MDRSTIALIPAGGTIRKSPDEAPFPKALFPVQGRPLLDYIVQAAEHSSVEKIFIIQDNGVKLQPHLSPASKVVILEKDREILSPGAGFTDALRKIARYYGPEEIKNKNIMLLPCDTPAVTSRMIDELAPRAARSHADVIFTVLPSQLVEQRFPEKRFYKFYLADKKGWYTVPFVYFINGEFFQFLPGSSPDSSFITVRDYDEARLKSFENLLNSIDNMRKDFGFTFKFFARWMLEDGNVFKVLKTLIISKCKKMTVEKFIAFDYQIFKDHIEVIDNQEPEFCGDIDKPEDVAAVLGELVQTRWTNAQA